MFIEIIDKSSQLTKKRVKIMKIGYQSSDRPVIPGIEESLYLKCLLLYVD